MDGPATIIAAQCNDYISQQRVRMRGYDWVFGSGLVKN